MPALAISLKQGQQGLAVEAVAAGEELEGLFAVRAVARIDEHVVAQAHSGFFGQFKLAQRAGGCGLTTITIRAATACYHQHRGQQRRLLGIEPCQRLRRVGERRRLTGHARAARAGHRPGRPDQQGSRMGRLDVMVEQT